jgi:Family of unknown function (DUF6338)
VPEGDALPTSVTGAVVFVLLLLPGFVYLLKSERSRKPGRQLSALRETVTLVFASAGALTTALLLFSVYRILVPDHSPDVGHLVRETSTYVDDQYAYLLSWSLGLLLLACLVADAVATWGGSAIERLFAGDVAHESAWWSLFEYDKAQDKFKVVTCVLQDGGHLQGTLYLFNQEVAETENRELVLAPPIYIGEDGKSEWKLDKGAVIVSARRIKWLHVSYLTDEEYQSSEGRGLDLPVRRESEAD